MVKTVGENEAILRRWIEEVWNKGSEKTIEELFDAAGVVVSPATMSETPIRGIDEFKAFYRQIRQIFSDIKVTIGDVFEEGEKVVAFCHFSAKRRLSDSNGTVRLIPVISSGLCQIKVDGGKIYDSWNNFDLFSDK